MVRRICLFGAPGAGKTVLTHELFVHYKKKGRNCEIVNELAREWAYLDRPIQSMDQIYLFGTQLNREDSLLSRNKVDFIISDSPVLLNSYYGVKKDGDLFHSYFQMFMAFEKKFPSINLFCMNNPNYLFHSEGRFHTRDEADDISREMIDYMKKAGVEYHVLPNEDRLEAAVKILDGKI